MKTITFALQKGGTGKTSISVSVACQLSITNKVLLIDADPQGNSSSWLLKEYSKEFADVLNNNENIKDCITKTSNSNLDILATFGIGGELKNYRESSKAEKPYFIQDLLKSISNDYDFCIIDTSPSNSKLERNVYIASDEIIPVLQLSQFSIDGLEIFINNLNEIKSDFHIENPILKTLVLNAKDSRIGFQKDSVKIFENANSNFNVVIFPTDTTFNKAQQTNKPIQEFANLKLETKESLKKLVEFIKE